MKKDPPTQTRPSGFQLPAIGRRSRTFCVSVLVLFLTLSGWALDPNVRISQYAHSAWRVQDGYFSGTPQAITQTTDGYLWIGTEGGLVRFDGVRFTPWTALTDKQLPGNGVHALLSAKDGSLWIGTQRGLAHWSKGDLTNLTTVRGFIETILQDPEGNVWISRSQLYNPEDGALCEASGSTIRCYGPSSGMPFPYAQPLFRDVAGNFWIGSSAGVCRWTPVSSKVYPNKALESAKGLSGVSAIVAGSDGSLFVGTRRPGKGGGLQRLVKGSWSDYVVPGMDGTKLDVAALLVDRDHNIWVGTSNEGIYRVHDGQADHLGSADGLSSDSVQGFFEDREGDLWVATARGLDRLHDVRVVSYSIREGLTSDDVDSVVAAPDGTVWIGNSQALDIFRHGKLSAIAERSGLPGTVVTSLFEDREGRLWVGLDNKLAVYEQGRFRTINNRDGTPLGVVVGMTEDSDRNIWANVTRPALVRIRDLAVEEEFKPPQIARIQTLVADPKDGIWLAFMNGDLARLRQGKLEPVVSSLGAKGMIRDLVAEPDGSMWGATRQGLYRWQDGRGQFLDSSRGLPCEEVFSLGQDDRGALWLSMPCGLGEIDRAELDRWDRQPDTRATVKTYDVFDGAQPGLSNFRPRISRSPDGKLWFANENILQVVDPSHMAGNPVPPPVHVEQMIADHKNYAPGEKLRLPALTRDIEIDYTALSLTTPEKVQFRYKLDGHDTDWQNPQARRQAFYSDLGPGNYEFHVTASNNDGVWNEQGAILPFSIAPAFFQTAWFRFLCFLAGAGLLWSLYALRLHQVAQRMRARFDERLAERERIARDLHDTLLQGIFSASIHLDLANNRLPEGAPAKAALERGVELLRQVSVEGRNTLRALRSPHLSADDLEQSISRIQEECEVPDSVNFRVVVEGRPRVLRPIIRDEVYRIAREAVVNAIRHSQASQIEVQVDYKSRSLVVSVRDNGCGIDAQVLERGREGHWGLAGMRERAEKIGGKLEVMSRVGAGTEVQLLLPGKRAFESSAAVRFWRSLRPSYPQKPGSPRQSE